VSLTRREAAVIGAYTGVLMGCFADLQALGDEVMGRTTWTHDYGSSTFQVRLKAKVRDQFLAICDEVER